MDEQITYLLQPGFVRLWQLVKEKYQRHGRVGGKVEMNSLSQEEIEALSGLLAMNLYGQTRLTIPLTQIDEALQSSKFRIGLVAALAMLFPDLRTHEERRSAASAKWSAFCRWSKEGVGSQEILGWIDRLTDGGATGHRTYLECYKEYEQSGECGAWRNTTSALEKALSAHEVFRLPVFAALVTGDPHGLDRNTLAGKMFYWGLRALTIDVELPERTSGFHLGLSSIRDFAWRAELDDIDASGSAENTLGEESGDIALDAVEETSSEYVRAVYMKAGIRLDDVSSIVWVANWPNLSEAPIALTLMALETHITEVPAVQSVYVVENPSVFAELIEQLPQGIPVVCTSGQPSVAALRLLDMAVTSGASVHYNGDFDVKGLQMAASLRKRYGEAWKPWHMDADTYRLASDENQPKLVDAEVRALQNLEADWDDQLIAAMDRLRRKVFQEHILSTLLSDFDR